METGIEVYKAINGVQADLAKAGIVKDRKNQAQGYNFRGIDDCYNALAPLLPRHCLCILPRALSREVVERSTAKGNAMFYVTVEVEFDFVCSKDGSKHTVKTYGEAMDTADKATNKAMSAAYKYAVLQSFSIPTEGDNDADASTHEVKASPPPPPPPPSPSMPHADTTPEWASKPQLTKINAMWGTRPREELYRFLTNVCGREIVSGRDLTISEAGAVIDALEAETVTDVEELSGNCPDAPDSHFTREECQGRCNDLKRAGCPAWRRV